MKKKRLIYGIGINDADYQVQKSESLGCTDSGKQIRKLIWICPFYSRWISLLQRCYSEKCQQKQPTYKGCSVVPEWHYFMTFRAWMIQQDWQGKQLDKDILFPGNKIYAPDSCVFVDGKVNKFLTESTASRGEWPIGVYFHKEKGKFQAECGDVITGKRKYLGSYTSPEEAHEAWLSFKLEQAKILAEQQTDERVSKALIERYKNYK